jgi:hypothetical protein
MIGRVDMKPGDPPSLLKIDLLNIGLVQYQLDHMTVTRGLVQIQTPVKNGTSRGQSKLTKPNIG